MAGTPATRASQDPHPSGPALGDAAAAIRLRLLVRMSILHMAGALLVFAYLQSRYPTSQILDIGWLNDVVVLILTELVGGLLLWLWIGLEFRRSAGWALDGVPPQPADRERILGEPFRMAARPFAIWVLGATAISAAASVRSRFGASEIADTAQIMVLGGFATCALSYFLIEQTYRPLFAVVLGTGAPTRPRTLGVRTRLLLAWAASSGIPLAGTALVPIRSAVTSPLAIGVLGAIGLAAGLYATSLAAHSIARPLRDVRAGLARVSRGDLFSDLPVDDGGEIGQLQAGFNQMVHGLRERQRLEDLFSRHVGHEVAAQAMERGTGLGGEQRRASVIFVDLIGSTAMAEVLPPGEVVSTLNAFFRTVVAAVTEEGGWVNKFEGDGALCVFGVPGFQPDHEQRALRAARRLRAGIEELRTEHPGLAAGIGVSSGVVVAGNVGSEERFEYTVIGRPVNEAARLTDLAKERSGHIVASAATVRAAGPEQEHWVDRGRVALRGQQSPTAVFEPAGAASPADRADH